jgi:DNA-binding response OmpR family regulator
MPKLNGIEVCRRLKGDAALPFMSMILVTTKTDTKDVVVGLTPAPTNMWQSLWTMWRSWRE